LGYTLANVWCIFTNPIGKIIDEIEKIIGYVKKYHPESLEKNRVVNDISNSLADIDPKSTGKSGKKKGLFSLFK